MSATGTAVSTPVQVLSILTSGWQATETAIVAAVSNFSITELVKLGTAELTQCWQALKTFVANMRAGMTWGAAMAGMLTQVWNDTKSELAQLATDFVELVGTVFQNAGLLAAGTV